MKKVLIVTTIQNTVEAFLIPHIKLLESMGYKVWIATSIKREITTELKKNYWVDISFNRNPLSFKNFQALKQMKDLIENNDFEIINLHTPIASFIGRYIARKNKNIDVIYTVHGLHFYKGAPIINWLLYYPLEKLAINWTNKIITINMEDYERIKRMSSQKTKIYKINGIGLDIERYQNGNSIKIREELRINKEDIIITIIGELNKNKNQIQLLKAVSLLKEKNIQILLVGVGKTKKRLEKIAFLNNLKVNFLGYRKDINDIIAASDIVCSLSYREGLPRNVMEAMSQGKPIIATKIRGNCDLIKNGVNGYLVKINDYRQTANKIEEIILNKELKEKIKENNFKEIMKYSLERILEETKKIYLE